MKEKNLESQKQQKICSDAVGPRYYEIIVVDGRITRAFGVEFSSSESPKIIHYYSDTKKDYNALSFVIIGIISYLGIHLEKLKELYLLLTDEDEKKVVRDVQDCLLKKLSF